MDTASTTSPPTATIDAHTDITVTDTDPALDIVTIEVAGAEITGPLGHLSRIADEIAYQLMLVDRARGVAEEALERARGKANVAVLRDVIDRARAEAVAAHIRQEDTASGAREVGVLDVLEAQRNAVH